MYNAAALCFGLITARLIYTFPHQRSYLFEPRRMIVRVSRLLGPSRQFAYDSSTVLGVVVEASKSGFVPYWKYQLIVRFKDGSQELVRVYDDQGEAQSARDRIESLLSGSGVS